MRKQYTYKPVALRFRRWSRKRYAAFISIQRAVTIGQLSANVSERFQAKNGSIHTSVLTFDKTGEGEAEEEGNTCCPDSSGSILSLLFLQTVCPVQTVSQPFLGVSSRDGAVGQLLLHVVCFHRVSCIHCFPESPDSVAIDISPDKFEQLPDADIS